MSVISDLRPAFRELGLLVRRAPAEDRAWRDFWITWIPSFLPFLVVLTVLDPPFFSLIMLAALAGTAVWALLLTKLFARIGITGRSADQLPR